MSVYYTKYLILGAGCSGLAFANHLKGSEYIIMEKNNTGGGAIAELLKRVIISGILLVIFFILRRLIGKTFLNLE